MLQPIDMRSDGSIAQCPDTGARLLLSRAQYTLVVDEPSITRHWSRRKVSSDVEAIERANKSLKKIVEQK